MLRLPYIVLALVWPEHAHMKDVKIVMLGGTQAGMPMKLQATGPCQGQAMLGKVSFFETGTSL